MKKIINKLFAGSLLAGMMLVSSCAGDYLDTAPTDSTGATDAVGTTANAMKALNGIAKIMTTQHSYFGGGFAGENNIMIQYESYPSENSFPLPYLRHCLYWQEWCWHYLLWYNSNTMRKHRKWS